MTMLVAALIRLAFDVQINPATGGIAIRRSKRCYRGASRPVVFRRSFIDTDARKPGLAVESSAIANSEQNVILRACRGESKMDAGPIVRASDRFRMQIERHGRHGQRGADRD